jgi:hypothetical protein
VPRFSTPTPLIEFFSVGGDSPNEFVADVKEPWNKGEYDETGGES